MEMFYGILGGMVLCGVIVLVVYQVQSHFIGRVQERLDTFTAEAHKDIEAYKEGMTTAIKDHSKKVMDVVVDVKGDVEKMKQFIGGIPQTPDKPRLGIQDGGRVKR